MRFENLARFQNYLATMGCPESFHTLRDRTSFAVAKYAVTTDIAARLDFFEDSDACVTATFTFSDEPPCQSTVGLIRKVAEKHGATVSEEGDHRIRIFSDSALTASRVVGRVTHLLRSLY